jgi:formylmethanofuran dehydrogenase subunit C
MEARKKPRTKCHSVVAFSLVDIGGKEIAKGEWLGSCRVSQLFRVAYRYKRGSPCKLMWGTLQLKPMMTMDSLDSNSVDQVTVVWLRNLKKNIWGSAFVAITKHGSVVTWGRAVHGGDSSSVAGQLQRGVVHVTGNSSAFAAIKDDGSVVTWGRADHGGDSSSIASQLQGGVLQVTATAGAFAAMKEDGSVVTWGYTRLQP